jgi:hypothetical protein
MNGVFPARFNSGCIACEGRIHEGDLVKWADDSVIHADCMVLDDNMREVRPACPRCFMVPAVNGKCGCDE